MAALVLTGCGGNQPPSSHVDAITTTAASTVVRVWFLDKSNYDRGTNPYVVPVTRSVPADDQLDGVLTRLFGGPTKFEKARGLRLVSSGATGVSRVRVERSTALVRLVGGCSSGGSTVTIGVLIITTLKQFARVTAVKIYDPSGRTETPDVPGDSIPACLEP